MATQREKEYLYTKAMKGHWNAVVEMYKKIPATQTAKISKSDDTALHIAVSVDQTETAVELVDIVDRDSLNITNVRGNTALHVAAALGDLEVCESMVKKNSNLMAIRNNDGEIPLFLAALNGKKETFSFLIAQCTEAHHSMRRNNGDTILHVAIAGEYFSLAMNIIKVRPELVNSINVDGYVVDDLKEERHDVEAYVGKIRGAKESQIYPRNYQTCRNFLVLLHGFFQALCGLHQSVHLVVGRKKDGSDEENPQQKNSLVQGTSGASTSSMSSESKVGPEKLRFPLRSRSQSGNGQEEEEKTTVEENPSQEMESNEDDCFPPNYDIWVSAFKLIMKVLPIIVLAFGFWRIKEIQRKKKQHMWANRVMNELVKHTTSYKAYDNTGWEPKINRAGEGFDFPNDLTLLDTKEPQMKRPITKNQLTPILIAAKMGVVEIIEKILDEYPFAIQDFDSNNKNVVLLAVESRQTQVFTLLVNKLTLKESVFRQVDNEGNSALHLAARCNDLQPWFIPGGALQMQWEIKRFKLVKHTMPARFFPEYNKKHETPEELFNKTHQKLVKDASDSLSKTSNSCSVVAALVASVVFATSTTVPGGVNDASGVPVLKEKPAFQAFAIASVVALCSSVTALVFFLSILACHRYEDFALNLPRKLFLAFTFLIISIASMLLSFFAGHNFIVSDELRYIAYPLYAAVCFPLAIFALEQLSLYLNLISAIFQKLPQQVYEVQRVI